MQRCGCAAIWVMVGDDCQDRWRFARCCWLLAAGRWLLASNFAARTLQLKRTASSSCICRCFALHPLCPHVCSSLDVSCMSPQHSSVPQLASSTSAEAVDGRPLLPALSPSLAALLTVGLATSQPTQACSPCRCMLQRSTLSSRLLSLVLPDLCCSPACLLFAPRLPPRAPVAAPARSLLPAVTCGRCSASPHSQAPAQFQ